MGTLQRPLRLCPIWNTKKALWSMTLQKNEKTRTLYQFMNTTFVSTGLLKLFSYHVCTWTKIVKCSLSRGRKQTAVIFNFAAGIKWKVKWCSRCNLSLKITDSHQQKLLEKGEFVKDYWQRELKPWLSRTVTVNFWPLIQPLTFASAEQSLKWKILCFPPH